MAERVKMAGCEAKAACECPKSSGGVAFESISLHATRSLLQSAVIQLARRWTTRMDEVLMDGGLNTAQLAVLDLLSKHSAGLTQREAAHALVLSETVMSTRVAGLVAGGLVERNALIGDRRAHLLRLTDKGREAAGVWSVCTSCIRHSAENAIAVEDLSTALSVLTRMTAALDAHDCSKTAHVGLPRLAPRTEEIPRPPSDGSPNKHAITIQDRHRRA